MKISEMYQRQHPVISFEFFPPKTDAGMTSLLRTLDHLKTLSPSFVSVTYGAGGSTRDKTVDLVRRIKRDAGIETMSHLSCVGTTKAEIEAVLQELQGAGIDNVLALGGDPPRDQEVRDKSEWAFVHANELAAYIKTKQYFCIGGACYPEGHSHAPSKEVDLFYCKKKVEDGVDFLITQLFFDNRDYFDFVSRARVAGIEVPIVPGIMPVTNFTQIKRFTQLCGAAIPEQMAQDLTPIEADGPQVEAYGIEYATQQCRELLDAGAPGFHFYTLNKAEATTQILENLGLT
ncbi:MAG TPA: methylenetetrahydrofolate reductase [NAD(P)H] [Candidatus Entotheonella sp.]|jgi:methylenetetrahydrofolate reductase (NADPH)